MRRTHRKSRNGCAECKRRHMKCDENRPICVQCTTSRRPCSYSITPTTPPASLTPAVSHTGASLGALSTYSSAHQNIIYPPVSTPHVESPASSRAVSRVHHCNLVPTDPSDPFLVNMLHLQLMQQFSTETGRTFLLVPEDTEASIQIVLKSGLQHSFLMPEILAIAALHLGFLLPEEREHYHHQATGLQARALSIFNNTSLDVGPENCVAISLFSSLLALHSLCDVVESREKNPDNFLSAYINSLDIHRGSRTVIQHSWHLLRQTEMRPILDAGVALASSAGLDSIGSECDDLRRLLTSADMSQTSINTCQNAIEHLQTAFDQERKTGGRTTAYISWPAMVQSEYMDLLMKRNPEALVILTRYGVLLHCHRDLWCIASAGRYLIESINRHLGPYWESWLVWPNEVIRASLDQQS